MKERYLNDDYKLSKCQFGMLRVFGTVGICIMHYHHLYAPEGFSNTMVGIHLLNCVALHGAKLVPLFFMLSGYGITLKYLSVPFDGLEQFMKQRLASLLPATIVSTIIMAFGGQLYFVLWGEWWTGREASLYNIAGNLLGFQSLFPRQFMDTVNGPTWYVYSLILCYIVFGICQKKIGRKAGSFWILCAMMCIGGIVYQIDLPLLNATTFDALFSFSLGCVLAIKTNSYNKSLYIWKGLFFISLLILLVGGFSGVGGGIFGNLEKIMAVTIYPCCIISGTLVWERFLPLLGKRKIKIIERAEKFLRDLSFYVYLYNLPCLILFGFVGKYIDFYYGSLKSLFFFLLINIGCGIIVLHFSQTVFFMSAKEKFVGSCNKFLEEII